MLKQSSLIAFSATRDAERAKIFYRDVLGLRLVTNDPFALVFDAHGTMLRVQKTPPFKPLPFTVLGWQVTNIDDTVDALSARGVTFERFEGMAQDERAIWQAPSGSRIAWFKDPDGNLPSLTLFGA
jgi:catechol 2,3-dioxygenase-like lactoylglutathione lyase family enzyme